MVFVETTEDMGYGDGDLSGMYYAVISSRRSPLADGAAVLMPSVPWTGKEGTVTNLEGRTLRLNRGDVRERAGKAITAILAGASMLHGGKVRSNPVAR